MRGAVVDVFVLFYCVVVVVVGGGVVCLWVRLLACLFVCLFVHLLVG